MPTDRCPPLPYVAFEVPVGIESVQITWEDGSVIEAPVVRPVADDALGFAAVAMPRTQADFSYVGLDGDDTPITDVQQRPPAL